MTAQPKSDEAPDTRIGRLVGSYLIAAHVADGAMGRVYEAYGGDKAPGGADRRVAIKVLHRHVVQDPVAVERFRREYDAAREMDHPHIVRVFEFGTTVDGAPYMVMEFLDGQGLGPVLRDGGGMPTSRVVRILCQTALALDYAHSYGFIHRDLKPDNLFVGREGDEDHVRLLDFGSVKLQIEMGAKLTALGMTLGSPYYMSPEQAAGQLDVDQRSDVFALGAILYEMLAGRRAFEAPNVAQILMRVMHGQPTPLRQVLALQSSALDGVIGRALHKDKTLRYATASELAQELLEALKLPGTPATWAVRPHHALVQALAQQDSCRADAALASPQSLALSSAPTLSPPSEPPKIADRETLKLGEDPFQSAIRSDLGWIVGIVVIGLGLIAASLAWLR